MAGYSIASYLLQIKDRHNANIMIDEQGHLIHIDFGFIMDISPGNNMGFEQAEFKLVKEMVAIMDGPKSEPFKFYKEQTMKAGLLTKHYYEYLQEPVIISEKSGLSCFRPKSIERFENRFLLEYNDLEAAHLFDKMIDHARNNLRTNIYDVIQYLQNKILY